MSESNEQIKEPIASPYTTISVTPEMLNEIKRLTKAKSIFIAISDEDGAHKCAENCQGHFMNINVCGFTNAQIVGIAQTIAESAKLKLVPIDEEEEEDELSKS